MGFNPDLTRFGLPIQAVGLELWWFLLSKPKGKQLTLDQGIQKLTIQLDGGYETSQMVVKAGATCPTQIFFAEIPAVAWRKFCYPIFGLRLTYL